MKLSETVQEVIALAEAIGNYWDTELPKRHPRYPLVQPGEDSGPPPPEEAKLRELLVSLPGDDIYKLALIAYLGRRAFGTDDLPAHFEAMKESLGTPEEAAVEMIEKASLADDLRDGLAELRKSGFDVDRLASTAVGSSAE